MNGFPPTTRLTTPRPRPHSWRIPTAVIVAVACSQVVAAWVDFSALAALLVSLSSVSLVLVACVRNPDRHQAEQRLGIYRAAFDYSGSPLLISRAGQIVCMNSACKRLLNIHTDNVESNPLETWVPQEWLPHFIPRVPSQDGPPDWNDHVGLTGPDGAPLTILLISHVIKSSDSTPFVTTACIDLTVPTAMRRQQAELIEKSKNYVQNLINVIPQPVYVRDSQSRYLIVNEALAAVYQRTPEEMCGLTPWDLVSDQTHAARSTAEDQEVLAGRSVFKEVTRPYGIQMEARCVVVSKGACYDPEGMPVIVGAHFDVTKWRQAEQQLQDSLMREVERRKRYQDYVQRLIDVIPHPVYVKDRHSRCLIANEAYALLLAQPKESLPGRSSTLGLDTDTASIILKEDAAVLAGLRVQKEESDKPFPGDQGRRYRVITKGRCIDTEGEPVVVCAMFDVTDWRLAESRWIAAKEDADRANEAKTLFLANMSHELRTPMHAVLSFARLGFTRTEHNPHTTKERGYFERIVRSGERLLGLLNNLLDLAKLEGGQPSVHLRNCQMRPIIEEVISEFTALIDTKKIRVELIADPDLAAKGDSAQMGQVIRNLLANAIKYSPASALITVSVSSSKLRRQPEDLVVQAVEVRVSDQGIGIPEAELETVFDKFVQSSKTHSGAGGTGLGLSICREIVRQHGGEIFARNRNTGGAEFVVRIPCATDT